VTPSESVAEAETKGAACRCELNQYFCSHAEAEAEGALMLGARLERNRPIGTRGDYNPGLVVMK
jgi:hypothetical protein